MTIRLLLATLAAWMLSPNAWAGDTPYCREFTQTISIGGKIQQGYGTSCRQPDGSWKIIRPLEPHPHDGRWVEEDENKDEEDDITYEDTSPPLTKRERQRAFALHQHRLNRAHHLHQAACQHPHANSWTPPTYYSYHNEYRAPYLPPPIAFSGNTSRIQRSDRINRFE